jgi:hypothetical protein
MNLRTKQRNLGKCKCGRPILTGYLRTYNGSNTNLCPQCNAERIINEVTGRDRVDNSDSDGHTRESGTDDRSE